MNEILANFLLILSYDRLPTASYQHKIDAKLTLLTTFIPAINFHLAEMY